MSAGAFQTAIYERNDGTFSGIRVQPETLALTVGGTANAEGAGPVTAGSVSAKVGKSVREYGLGARTITLKFNDGDQPAGYKADSPITLPVLTPAVWNAAALGVAIQYLGSAAQYVGKSPERVR